jgi:hypothetical protein
VIRFDPPLNILEREWLEHIGTTPMRKKNSVDDYVSLAIRISKFEVTVGASINVHLRTTVPYSWDDSDSVVAPDFRLVITGICTYPETRANDSYEITVYGERLAREKLTFEQIRVRDKYNVPVYRKYRGKDYPVFKVPPGIATVERLRGTSEWHAGLFVEPKTASRMLAVLSLERELYASIDEQKVDRQRWVRGFSLQTRDPANE